MNITTNIINCLAFSVSYVLLILSFHQFKIQFVTKLGMMIFGLEFLSVHFELEMFSSFPIAMFVALILMLNGAGNLKALFIAMTSIILIFLFGAVLGSILLIYQPQLAESLLYNYFMSGCVVLFGIVTRWYRPSYIFQVLNSIDKHLLRIIISVEMILLFLCSIVIPIAIGIKNNTAFMFVFYIAFSIVIFILMAIFVYLNFIHVIKKDLEQEHQNIICKHDEMVNVKHYFTKLYSALSRPIMHGDIDEIKKYFNKYIVPTHLQRIAYDFKHIDSTIHSELIRNLVYDTICKMEEKQFTFNLEIVGDIRLDALDEYDIFIVLGEFIENAIEEIDNQDDGYINLFFIQDSNEIHLRVENTLSYIVEIAKINRRGYTTKEEHAGAGLKMIEEIIKKRGDIQHMTYINKFNLFTQYLIIICKGEMS